VLTGIEKYIDVCIQDVRPTDKLKHGYFLTHICYIFGKHQTHPAIEEIRQSHETIRLHCSAVSPFTMKATYWQKLTTRCKTRKGSLEDLASL